MIGRWVPVETPRVLLPYPVLLERSSLVCFVLFSVGERENSEEMTTVSAFDSYFHAGLGSPVPLK